MVVLLGAKCSLFNKAPTVPAVTGPAQGVAGVPVTFKATATDPDGDSIAFQFDWGDTTTPMRRSSGPARAGKEGCNVRTTACCPPNRRACPERRRTFQRSSFTPQTTQAREENP
jgi:hypothetical protein